MRKKYFSESVCVSTSPLSTDSPVSLLEQLRLEYNKLRQQSITNELLDILGGQVR
ncbi:MAG: F0F1 ATP synthase subunit gamma [Lachnospiraceae bacterium]|nr:F0F1 ATP synthase subunit gamma [Lachnospiraceae bacterium]